MKNKITYFLLYTAAICFTAPLLTEEQTQEQSDVLTAVTPENTAESITFIAIVKNHPFSFYHPDGSPTGLIIDFWELWSKVNDIPIQIEMKNVFDSIEASKTKGHVHTGLFKLPDRQKWADFSLPIHNIKSGIWSTKNTPGVMKLSEMSGKKIAVLEGSYHQKYLEENHPEIVVVKYAHEQSLHQLLNGEIQAVFSENPSTSSLISRLGYTGLITLTEEEVFSNDVYATIAKGQPELLAKINAGIENIPVNEIIELKKKWLPTLKPFFSTDSLLASLTLTERKWLQNNRNFSIGFDPDLPPFEFVNENDAFAGLASDYIEYANEILGINMMPRYGLTWLEAFDAFKKGEIDIMSAAIITNERLKIMNFTKPYVDMPTAIVTRRDTFYVDNMVSLNHKTLGLVEGDFIKFIRDDYPDIKIKIVGSEIEGLDVLQAGEIDAFLLPIAVANYEIDKRNMNDLMIAAISPYNLKLSMAIRKGLEPLVPILNKAFDSMTNKQQSFLNNTWLRSYIKTGTELSTVILWVLPIISFLMLIIFIFVRMNKRLKIEVDGRKDSEKAQEMLVSQLHQSQKMEALGKLTGGIAHDFNNMLGIILGYAELLQRKPINEKQLTSYAEHISQAGERGSKLTKKLLSFTRKKHIEATQVDINAVLHQQQEILQKTLTVRIKITLKLCENVSTIYLDRSDLDDAILNMSINAMHAMSDNLATAELILKTENVVITKDYSEELGLVAGDYVKLCIIDNGCGMNKEISNQVFDPFFSTKGDKGTGLGLSQVFGFVQRSSGAIIVKSSLEQGTHFSLYFPKCIVEPEDEPTQLKSKVQNLKGNETLLVVDDELALLKLATEFLQVEGYNILVADSGESALMVLEKEQIDLVLTDVLMPEMDGYQLAEKIKENYPEMKIQLVSGFTDAKYSSFVGDDLQRDLIHKPYNRMELLQGVRTLLDT